MEKIGFGADSNRNLAPKGTQAVPGPENSVTEQEGANAETVRLERENLENLIVEIEGNPEHERRAELEGLRNRLIELSR